LVAGLAGVGACDHTQPFGIGVPSAAAPFDTAVPQQLTYNPGLDTTPAFGDSFIVYSRTTPDRTDDDACLAFLPITGGTLIREECPGGPTPDGVREQWLSPAVSPDGQKIAFVRLIGQSGGIERQLVVAPADSLNQYAVLINGVFPNTDSTFVNGYRHLSWHTDDSVRFLGVSISGQDSVVPRGIFAVPISGGAPVQVPGIVPWTSYVTTGTGGIWYVPYPDTTFVMSVPPNGGMPTLLMDTKMKILDLAEAGGYVIATLNVPVAPDAPPGTLPGQGVFRFDSATGAPLSPPLWPAVNTNIVGQAAGTFVLMVAPEGGSINVWRTSW